MKTIITICTIILLAAGCAHSPNRLQIRDKIAGFDDVDDFAAWLDEQTGIENVKVNRQVLLTSLPPQVVVLYDQNGESYLLLLQVEDGRKLTLVKPE